MAFQMKKSLNMLENPVYPDIKAAPPRFVNSKKFWQVDAGATMRDLEPYTQFFENSILAQSRDYNKTIYGQSSHRDIVNAEFRPPLQSPYEDFGPLSRIPCTINSIIPHINPGTADQTGGSSGYAARNQRPSDIEGSLTDRLKDNGGWRPTFYAPMEMPEDNSVLPDLETKLPPMSIQAGWNIPYQNYELQPPSDINLKEKISNRLDAGYNSSITIEGQSSLENFQARLKRPNYAVTAGANTIFTNTDNSNLENFQFESKMPYYSLDAGKDTSFTSQFTSSPYSLPELSAKRPYYAVDSGKSTGSTFDMPVQEYDLKYKSPQISATSGMTTQVTFDAPAQTYDLQYKSPQISATSGMTTQVTFDAPQDLDQTTLNREKNVSYTPITINNIGSEGYNPINNSEMSTKGYITNKRPNYSYVVPNEVPTYRTQNEQTYRPHFVEKLMPEKTYGNISQSSGYIPRAGVENPGNMGFSGLDNNATKSNSARSRMGYEKKKSVYRI